MTVATKKNKGDRLPMPAASAPRTGGDAFLSSLPIFNMR